MQNNFRLYLVTDRNLSKPHNLKNVVKLAAKGGITAVQLREKTASTREFISIAQDIKNILAEYNIPLIINDRIDVALAVDADGVHIGQNDIPYHIARKLLTNKKIIGLSVENIEQAIQANNYDVDYVGVSPIFTTPTKTDIQTSWGLEGLSELRKISKHKLIAIGGINLSNAGDVLDAGADGIAVVSAICSASNPQEATEQLKQIVDRYIK